MARLTPFVTIQAKRPVILFLKPIGFGTVVYRPNKLGWVLECRIVDIDFHHRQESRQRNFNREEIAKFLLENVADHSLRLCTEYIEGVCLNFRIGLSLKCQETNLWSVSVGYHELVPLSYRGQCFGGDHEVAQLIFRSHRFSSLEEGVTTERDDATTRIDLPFHGVDTSGS